MQILRWSTNHLLTRDVNSLHSNVPSVKVAVAQLGEQYITTVSESPPNCFNNSIR